MSATTLLALDGGQSGIRTQLDGAEITEFSGVLTDRPVVPQLAKIASQALAGRSVEYLTLGVSGLGPSETASQLHEQLAGAARQVLLAHDATTSYLGALGIRQGAVIAAGTGAVTLAVGPSAVQRVDGWGYLVGDLGAGFWIGREGIAAVLRDFDGRGPATALRPDVEADFGDLTEVYLKLQADPNRVARIASWARRVAELAPTDAVCAEISAQAGAHLAQSVAAGLNRVGAEPVVSCLGNVFKNRLIKTAFDEQLAALVPDVEIVAAAGTGLAGAAELVNLSPDSPLGKLIDRAG